ncbi:hypothetical protein [Azohydromonas australica]|uniref:hypothetical protein n=1 Tax=Azohydromonas australica TaxID=364039 RepID=UPI00146EC48C|nr:hypothetical protein [Azohydromonas australica]
MKARIVLVQALLASALVSACGGGDSEVGTSSSVEQKDLSAQKEKTVRFIYFHPANTSVHAVYSSAIERAALSIQDWYAQRLGGYSFRLASPAVETCQGRQPGSYYATQSWSRVAAAVRDCIPEFAWNDSAHRWVIYADVRHQCGDRESLGASAQGVAILPVQDLQGVSGESVITDDCGAPVPYEGAAGVNRWIGGLGHELGHALGLPHPAGCEEKASACDDGSLMWLGYVNFPNIELRDAERAALKASPFIVSVPSPQ